MSLSELKEFLKQYNIASTTQLSEYTPKEITILAKSLLETRGAHTNRALLDNIYNALLEELEEEVRA